MKCSLCNTEYPYPPVRTTFLKYRKKTLNFCSINCWDMYILGRNSWKPS